MRKAVGVALVSALVLTSCAAVRTSALNPLNWFGRSEPVATTDATGAANPLIPQRRASIFRSNLDTSYRGQPIADVTELLVERRPGGAIIRATGVASRAGPFDVRLVKDDAASTGSTLAYTLNALQLDGPQAVGASARSVTAAIWITDQDLAGIRSIRVSGRNSARVTRR